jgi:hypothetical protein
VFVSFNPSLLAVLLAVLTNTDDANFYKPRLSKSYLVQS